MKPLRNAFLAGTLSCFAIACGGSSGVGPQACETVLAGDLVITEIMGNPNGTDTGNEWFEIYNATSTAIDLQDITLVASHENTTGENSHTMPSTMIGAGAYLVLGDVWPDFLPAHVDYGYGADLGGLRNSAGRLAIFCGQSEIDSVLYETMDSGEAKGLTGSVAPDYIANDTLSNWCNATVEYMAMGFTGSPGTANENCAGAHDPQDGCDESGTVRDVNKPVVGDLVITEVMPNPTGVDNGKEWLEVLVVNTVDLNGVEVGSDPGTVKSTISHSSCLTATTGTYLVFSRNSDMLTNGGVTVDHDLGFTLANAAGDNVFVGIDGTVLDKLVYTVNVSGASNSLDPDFLNSTDNDNEANWCAGATAYGDGDLGTPGRTNDPCPPTVGTGECLDNGVPRTIIAPSPGDLAITEYMANPNVISDANGEWFEFRTNASFDLNHLELGRIVPTVDDNVISTACMPVNSGDHILVARNADNGSNGGLPAVDITYGFAMLNGADGGLFISSGGTVIDSVTWSTTTAGDSTQLDPGGLVWCDGMTAYGTGDNFGTPRSTNELCP